MLKKVTWIFLSILFLCFSEKTFSQSLNLNQAIEQALAKNPTLLKLQQERKAIRAEFWEGISPKNPKIFNEFENVPESSHSISDFGVRKMGIVQSFEFPLTYFFRGQWHASRSALIDAEYLKAQNEIVAEVKKRFYKVLLLQQHISLHQEIKSLTEELYRKAQIRVEAGESPYYDALKVKVDLAEVENHATAVQKEFDMAQARLAAILGIESDTPPELVGEARFTPVKMNEDSLRRLSLASHPELSGAEATVRQQGASTKMAWSGLLPGLELKYFRQDFRGDQSPQAWGGEIGLTIPLWFFMRDQGKIRKAHHQLNAARWQAVEKKRAVQLEFKNAFSRLEVAQKQVQNYLENTMQEVEELVRIATRSYEEGEMGYLEVAEAMRTLNRTKAGYLDVLYDYLSAKADVEKAVGIAGFELK